MCVCGRTVSSHPRQEKPARSARQSPQRSRRESTVLVSSDEEEGRTLHHTLHHTLDFEHNRQPTEDPMLTSDEEVGQTLHETVAFEQDHHKQDPTVTTSLEDAVASGTGDKTGLLPETGTGSEVTDGLRQVPADIVELVLEIVDFAFSQSNRDQPEIELQPAERSDVVDGVNTPGEVVELVQELVNRALSQNAHERELEDTDQGFGRLTDRVAMANASESNQTQTGEGSADGAQQESADERPAPLHESELQKGSEEGTVRKKPKKRRQKGSAADSPTRNDAVKSPSKPGAGAGKTPRQPNKALPSMRSPLHKRSEIQPSRRKRTEEVGTQAMEAEHENDAPMSTSAFAHDLVHEVLDAALSVHDGELGMASGDVEPQVVDPETRHQVESDQLSGALDSGEIGSPIEDFVEASGVSEPEQVADDPNCGAPSPSQPLPPKYTPKKGKPARRGGRRGGNATTDAASSPPKLRPRPPHAQAPRPRPGAKRRTRSPKKQPQDNTPKPEIRPWSVPEEVPNADAGGIETVAEGSGVESGDEVHRVQPSASVEAAATEGHEPNTTETETANDSRVEPEPERAVSIPEISMEEGSQPDPPVESAVATIPMPTVPDEPPSVHGAGDQLHDQHGDASGPEAQELGRKQSDVTAESVVESQSVGITAESVVESVGGTKWQFEFDGDDPFANTPKSRLTVDPDHDLQHAMISVMSSSQSEQIVEQDDLSRVDALDAFAAEPTPAESTTAPAASTDVPADSTAAALANTKATPTKDEEVALAVSTSREANSVHSTHVEAKADAQQVAADSRIKAEQAYGSARRWANSTVHGLVNVVAATVGIASQHVRTRLEEQRRELLAAVADERKMLEAAGQNMQAETTDAQRELAALREQLAAAKRNEAQLEAKLVDLEAGKREEAARAASLKVSAETARQREELMAQKMEDARRRADEETRAAEERVEAERARARLAEEQRQEAEQRATLAEQQVSQLDVSGRSPTNRELASPRRFSLTDTWFEDHSPPARHPGEETFSPFDDNGSSAAASRGSNSSPHSPLSQNPYLSPAIPADLPLFLRPTDTPRSVQGSVLHLSVTGSSHMDSLEAPLSDESWHLDLPDRSRPSSAVASAGSTSLSASYERPKTASSRPQSRHSAAEVEGWIQEAVAAAVEELAVLSLTPAPDSGKADPEPVAPSHRVVDDVREAAADH